MQRVVRQLCVGLSLIAVSAGSALAQTALTWQQVREQFEKANPALQAGEIGIDESRAEEITANLRPNPYVTVLGDQIDPFNGGPPHGPLRIPSVIGQCELPLGARPQTRVATGECSKRDNRCDLRTSRLGTKPADLTCAVHSCRSFRRRRSSI